MFMEKRVEKKGGKVVENIWENMVFDMF